jgi:serine/threonine protein kinase
LRRCSDFGLAKEGVDGATSGAFSLCGTPEYLAPEILLKKGHGLASDWWNLGMVLYEMLTGLPPWYTTDRQQLFEALKSAPLTFPDHVSPIAQVCPRARFCRGLPLYIYICIYIYSA